MKASMKLAVAVGAIVAICAVAPAQAGLVFPDAQFEGRIAGDPHTYLGFDVKRAKGKRFIKKIHTTTPIACSSSYVGYLNLRVKGRIPVRKKGTFRATRTATGAVSGSDLRLTLRGRFGKGGKVKGKIQAKGEALLAARQGGGPTKCYTGVQNWRARRGAEVEPPKA